MIELGINLEYFHAAEDKQATRNRVFDIIARHLKKVRLDSLIVEKRKTGSALRAEERFYPEMLGYLLKYVLNGEDLGNLQEAIIVTDRPDYPFGRAPWALIIGAEPLMAY